VGLVGRLSTSGEGREDITALELLDQRGHIAPVTGLGETSASAGSVKRPWPSQGAQPTGGRAHGDLRRARRRVDLGVVGSIGWFPGETSWLSLCWAVLDLFIASALGLTPMEQCQLTLMRTQRMAMTPGSRTA
jgi:hypothetical protein